jgi:23S rRNA (guanosine2251-2'-O)-methyltransferase
MEDPTQRKKRRRSRRRKNNGATPPVRTRPAPAAGRGRAATGARTPAAPARSIPKGQLPDNFVYGVNPVAVALDAGQLQTLFYDSSRQSERLQHIHAQAQADNIEIKPLQRQGWARILPSEQHQGVAGLLAEQPRAYLEELVQVVGEESCILVLDRVQDPQNLGAVMRTAAATGADAVVLPKAGGCPITPAVHKASAGLSLTLRVVEDENLARAIEFLKDNGYWVIGCDSSEGEDATTFEFPQKRVIVMGNEGEGMRRLVREHCDYLVRIPMAPESLNISVAAGVVLYLARRPARAAWEEQRRARGKRLQRVGVRTPAAHRANNLVR